MWNPRNGGNWTVSKLNVALALLYIESSAGWRHWYMVPVATIVVRIEEQVQRRKQASSTTASSASVPKTPKPHT